MIEYAKKLDMLHLHDDKQKAWLSRNGKGRAQKKIGFLNEWKMLLILPHTFDKNYIPFKILRQYQYCKKRTFFVAYGGSAVQSKTVSILLYVRYLNLKEVQWTILAIATIWIFKQKSIEHIVRKKKEKTFYHWKKDAFASFIGKYVVKY